MGELIFFNNYCPALLTSSKEYGILLTRDIPEKLLKEILAMKWFSKQSKLVQILLLLIPFVNWITELVVRWSTWNQKGGLLRLVICLVVTLGGLVIGWLDAIWVLLTGHLFLQ